MITDQGGNIVWQWDDTDPFGDNLPNQNPNGTGNSFVFNLRFGGWQYFDVETGLFYNYFRDYDPTTGRFPESDPIGLAGGQASTYAYVSGNPLTLIDKIGLNPFQPSPVTALEEAILEGNVEAIETLAEAAGEDAEAALAQARANANKIKHIFDKAQHKLDPLVKNCGSPGRALQTLQRAAAKGASTSVGDGVFQEFTVNINGISVVVRGVLVNGVFQVGTAFIP